MLIYKNHMKKINRLLVLLLSLVLTGSFAFAQNANQNSYCKTGTDANLPVLKLQIKNMADSLSRLKRDRQNLRTPLDGLKEEILALDEELKPLRSRHQKAAKKASKSAKSYAKYKAKWLDTGELERLNTMIKTRKQKHALYKQKRTQYLNIDKRFKALANSYEHIARDTLDKNRDCQSASIALRQAGF